MKKSIPLQLSRGRYRLFLSEIKKRTQKIMKFFKSSKAITRGFGSKIILQNGTLGLHFQKCDSIFFLSLSHFEGVLRSCSQLYFFNPIVERVGTLHKRITSGLRLILCLYLIIGKMTSFENFTISMDVSNAHIQFL